jgi:hypothetical protein
VEVSKSFDVRGGCKISVRGQLLDYNSLLGSNLLTNWVLNKNKNNLIYIFLYNKKPSK